ncbi:MAG: ROK family protein [Planctomycetota bacterium]
MLDAIQARGPSTRAEVTEAIGVTFATVAKAVSSLLDAKLLEEYDEATVGRGRPAKRLRLSVSNAQVIGVAIEIDEVTVGAAGLDGCLRSDHVSFPTPPTYNELIAAIRAAIATSNTPDGPETLGLGVSVAAQVDQRAGRVAAAANLPYLTDKTLTEDLTAATGFACSLVRDTHAVAAAERLRGAAKGLDNFLLLHLGVGIGMGLVIDGRLFHGQHGYPGELGHTTVIPGGDSCHCGRKGCLETVASEWALTDRLGQQLGRRVSIDDVGRLFAAGDPLARKEVRRACKYLALGLSHAMHFLNPGRVVVYSRLFDRQPDLLPLLVGQVEKFALPLHFNGCEFVNARTSPIEGSIAHIIEHLSDALAPRLSIDGLVG